MTSEVKKGGFPTWAKVLIGLVIAGIIGFLALAIGTVVWFQGTFKEAQDPAKIAVIAKKVGQFQEPLPEGFKFVMGLDLAGINTLTVEHKPDGQMIFLICYPKAEADAETVLNKIAETGVHTGQTEAKFEKVTTKGKETVGGEEMPYVLGTFTEKKGGSHEGMFGCITPKGKDKTILIYSTQPAGEKFNFEVTKTFLQSFKGF